MGYQENIKLGYKYTMINNFVHHQWGTEFLPEECSLCMYSNLFLCVELLFVELPPCASSPCKNGGQCSNEDDSFSCRCPQDWYGNTCAG